MVKLWVTSALVTVTLLPEVAVVTPVPKPPVASETAAANSAAVLNVPLAAVPAAVV